MIIESIELIVPGAEGGSDWYRIAAKGGRKEHDRIEEVTPGTYIVFSKEGQVLIKIENCPVVVRYHYGV